MNTRDFASVPWADIPLSLAALHRELPADALVSVHFPPAESSVPPLDSLLEGAGFSAAGSGAGGGRRKRGQLRRMSTLPDVVGPGMRALVCGLNPSLLSAERGFGYAGATNRFWAAALSSGLVSVDRRPLDAFHLDGVGMTDVVKRPTARSHHLDPAEYQIGLARVERIVTWLQPAVVIFVGLEGWRAAKDRKAGTGWQATRLGQRPAYVMPSTSGANARTPLAALVAHLQTALEGPG